MKKSDLVKILQKEIQEEGDTELLGYVIKDENSISTQYLLSQTRVNKRGEKLPMSYKEFKEVKEREYNAKK